jgi:hypothetical protein
MALSRLVRGMPRDTARSQWMSHNAYRARISGATDSYGARCASLADAGAMAGKAHAANQGVGSLQGYFDQCMAR